LQYACHAALLIEPGLKAGERLIHEVIRGSTRLLGDRSSRRRDHRTRYRLCLPRDNVWIGRD
jgi:hypothetical protein